MARNDAHEVTARSSQGPAVQPAADLDSTEGDQSHRLCLDIIGFDVQVIPSLVIHRLYRQAQPGQRPAQRGELLLIRVNCARRNAKRLGPECGNGSSLSARRVNQYRREPAAMSHKSFCAPRRLVRHHNHPPGANLLTDDQLMAWHRTARAGPAA